AGGIWPREPDSLIDIATSPFLHGNLEHLAGNAMALFSLGLIAALAGLKRFTLVTLTIIVLGGFGIWLFSPTDHLTVGASGVVFGYFGYLLVRGLIDRRPVDLVVSAGVALAYGYVMWTSVGFGVTGISWQGHVSGFVGGLVAALVFRDRRRRPAPEPSTLPPSLSG
ncbi:MAG TPA: rhomboid family intramembrane serine protease, partial [Micromonosporaceae bacterium]|nr:rhomboid family intramembrane serine protease [Micromonosporaceae bacterium]